MHSRATPKEVSQVSQVTQVTQVMHSMATPSRPSRQPGGCALLCLYLLVGSGPGIPALPSVVGAVGVGVQHPWGVSATDQLRDNKKSAASFEGRGVFGPGVYR